MGLGRAPQVPAFGEGSNVGPRRHSANSQARALAQHSQTSAWRAAPTTQSLPGLRTLFPDVFELPQEPGGHGPGQPAQAVPNPPEGSEGPRQRPAEPPARDTAPTSAPQAVDPVAQALHVSLRNDEVLQTFLPMVDEKTTGDEKIWSIKTGDNTKRAGRWLVRVATEQDHDLRGGSIHSRIEPTLATRFPADRLRAPGSWEPNIRNLRKSMGHAADLLTLAVRQLDTPPEPPLQALPGAHSAIAAQNVGLASSSSEPSRHDAG